MYRERREEWMVMDREHRQMTREEVQKIVGELINVPDREENEETTVKPMWKIKESTKPDPVNSPSHYTHGGIETLDYIEAKGLDKDFHLANVIKYVSRAGYKISKLEDLKKAQFYLNRAIKRLEIES